MWKLILLFISLPLFAENLGGSSSSSACYGGVKNYALYRCVCRADLANATGGGVVSVPLQVNGTSTVVYTTTDALNGTQCQGTLASDPCNPAVLNGALVFGTYVCAEGTTTDTGFTVR